MRRPVLLAVAASATVGFGVFGIATGAGRTVTYLVTIVLLGVLVVRPTGRWGSPTSWRAGSRAGRWLTSPGGSSGSRATGSCTTQCWPASCATTTWSTSADSGWRAWLPGRPASRLMRRDPPAHGCRDRRLAVRHGDRRLNEVVEFAIALNVEDSNVGGYLNTGATLSPTCSARRSPGWLWRASLSGGGCRRLSTRPLSGGAERRRSLRRRLRQGHPGGRRDRRGCRSRRCSRRRPGRNRSRLPTGLPPRQPRTRPNSAPRLAAYGCSSESSGRAYRNGGFHRRMVRRARSVTRTVRPQQ